jgi:peptidyl-prolyl cis-trans isomerase SurA
MKTSMPYRFALPVFCAFVAASCAKTPGPGVAAEVNGRAITYAELDKQYQFAQLGSANDRPSDEQVVIQRLEVLRALIDGEIMLQRAEREGLLAADSEVEIRFTEMKAPYTEEEWREQLNERKLTNEELKSQLRRDLSVQKLLTRETSAKISIKDEDIADFFEANKTSFNRAEPQLHLAQILVTPTGDSEVRNLKTDNVLDDKQAKKKVEGLQNRLKQGEDFAELAQNYSEDSESAPAGGDLGFIPESALERANVELRRAILSLSPGQLTAPIETKEGYRIIKLITREPAGQRDLTDPNVQQTIRDTLMTRKDQLLRAAFYEVARNEADVKNYFAASIISGK